MLNKENIMEIVHDHQKEIDELELELPTITNENARQAVQSRLSFLHDNQYRYKLQARAWGIEV